jgi:glycosyltransferase involved in cell wall biosynthesis
MILGVNGIRLVRNRSGVARVIEALLQTFARLPQPFDDIRVYTPEPIGAGVRLPDIARNVVLPSPWPPSVWEQVTLPRAHGARDVLFCPSYISPFFARCPTLVAHHGSYEGYADRKEVYAWWPRTKARWGYAWSARTATVVTTVSEYSRRDMARFYGMPAERIHVVPDGVDTAVFRPIDDAEQASAWRRQRLGDDRPFVLYVGKPTKRRNLSQLLRAFAQLRAQRALPHRLVLIGTALPGTSFAEQAHALGIGDHVMAIPHATHAEVALAYNACSAMAYPSSYEGFGMPVLEAMACGTPVLALDNTAFPEFAQGVALLLPDAAVDTLAHGLARLLDDAALRAHMRIAGPARAAEYDWRIVAQRYLDLLIPLAGARP